LIDLGGRFLQEPPINTIIKGKLDGEVVVSQWGGYKGNTLYVFGTDGMVDELMEAGGIYLLLTNPHAGVHSAQPMYGKIQINSKKEKIELIEKYKGFAKIR